MKTETTVVLIKIGGSLITDKNKPFSLKKRALKIISQEVARARKSGKLLVVGHGAGSYAHVPAKKYKTKEGLMNKDSLYGLAEVADVAAQLNRIVVRSLLDEQVPAISVSPFSMMGADDDSLEWIEVQTIEEALKRDLLPVVYGDVVLDTAKGCTIFSTETVLGNIGLTLQADGWQVERVIHCGQTNGVYDADGETIPLITPKTLDEYRDVLGGSGGTDVTGGMVHKVEETMHLAERGIPGLIIDGIEHGSLSAAIWGEDVLGTRIEVGD